ncbi:MAG TPA: hypothetical protein VEK11_01150 [Thermoanaerobaculia bacterium]|jgi:hypothetical protein|nr:hypothetical protein [Thermoanaerobaculia bacterium]
MRRFVGVVVVSVLVSVTLPAQARVYTDKETSWIDRAQTRVVQFFKRFASRSFGDGLTIPRP